MTVVISDVIRQQLDRGSLPERVRCIRPGRPVGETLTWADRLGAYVSDVTGEVIWASFVRQGWGLDFCRVAPQARQLELVA
jgi:hypothetical protein